MADPFLGQINLVAFTFAPKGWAECNGQTLSIAQNTALFALCGTTYGGNGVSTFALPNLQGRAPVHVGPTVQQGQTGGEENHTLIPTEMPAHNHVLNASTAAATSTSPAGNVLAAKAATKGVSAYAAGPASQPLSAGAIGSAGGNQPHSNLQPSLTVKFVIALQGIFPSRN